MNREIAVLEKLEKELSLKELQIKSLLTITQAINDNVSADGLFNMYRSSQISEEIKWRLQHFAS